ncbi:MAG: hypothetical protein HYV03_07345, partial [Deltaproteobacteria bacterium]|nr:hypothetical protein [Deltaproteobacteria bacterium]
STEGDGHTDGGANDYEVERVSVGYSTIMIDGKIKITSVTLYSYDNSAGMVKPFSTVMATNESIAEPYAFNRTKSSWTQRAVAFLLRQLQRLGISEALADLFPPICYTYGRACAMAGESGEFKTQVVAFEGDKIIISVIDPKTGEELFRISRVLIPLGAWDASGSGAGTDSTGSGSNGSGSTGSSGGSVTSGTGSVTGGTVPCLVESGTVYRYGQPVAGTTCADAGSGATSTGSGTTSTEQLKGKK